ncbi:TetR/AcrR family transcriptional regulator [Micromonospora carbonacea]|uniref:TetR/AcrR family transcriptional regulator n=1 Tax=Micromonospora carbonacea TaxID=47853 RepID=A0A7H8XRX9_9ACTN|nr:TetR family transcriptional regulator [Micromonospora carbonacea]MBB5825290.1 AcrR family transcriptional regulator [Micromonospora carbonacea]QLD26632.1 TetR/AcrR family transcriptional regulator [Micromonospora carbonacea]
MATPRRTGRRPGNPGTREAILDAARAAFAERGFDASSIRSIAAAAGVDPALVHHYFGGKDQLFLAAMGAPLDPGELLPRVLAGDPDGVGERLVRTFLGVWDSPAGVAAVALLRSAVSNEWTARLLREFLVTQVLRRILQHLDVDPAELPLRGSLVASQLVGLALMRHVVRLEPVASAPAETLVAAVGPTVQRYLRGGLG